eukprot:1924597-Alexandrium_andersonii.AAC.1
MAGARPSACSGISRASGLALRRQANYQTSAGDPRELHIYCGSVWVGDLQTLKSTSGFAIQLCGAGV